MTSAADFADVLQSNERYAEQFDLADLPGPAQRGLGVLTCMDSRIDPLAVLGLQPGDAKIMRNAGARVTDDVLRTMALARHALGVERIMVVAHTRCKMASATRDEVVELIESSSGIDVRSLDFGLIADQHQALALGVERLRSWPFLAPGVAVGGFMYDVDTGRLTHLI